MHSRDRRTGDWRRSTEGARRARTRAPLTRDVIQKRCAESSMTQGGQTAKLADGNHPARHTRCAAWVRRRPRSRSSTCMSAFPRCRRGERESPHPRVELEMANVDARQTRRHATPAIEEVLKRVDEAAKRRRKEGADAPAGGHEGQSEGRDHACRGEKPRRDRGDEGRTSRHAASWVVARPCLHAPPRCSRAVRHSGNGPRPPSRRRPSSELACPGSAWLTRSTRRSRCWADDGQVVPGPA